MTIAGIRKLPGLSKQVNSCLAELQSTAPSLARDPTAQLRSGGQFQPAGVFNTNTDETLSQQAATGLTVAPGYIYVAELGQLVPTVTGLPVSGTEQGISQHKITQPAVSTRPDVDSEVSEDEDCPVEPTPGYRLAWRKDHRGRKYCEEKACRDTLPEMTTTWVKRADGRIYKEQVPKVKKLAENVSSKPSLNSQHRSTPTFVDYRQGGQQVSPRPHTSTASIAQTRREERLPTFVSTEERAGRESNVPTLVQHARMCPVSWTDKITSDQLNPIIWSWAYVAELMAARTGHAPDLSTGELEARLQHFLNVMEVTLQTSSKADYMGDSWKVGRLYHNKVQAKVDHGMTTWCKLTERWESATLPHELMAAQQELAPKFTKAKEAPLRGKKEADDKGIRCGTWNSWETKGTCKWESENTGRKCRRVHECSYCKTKKYTPVNHQRLFCPKKLAADAE